MKKVVVTGATGAIGTALMTKMVEQQIYVLAICQKNSLRKKNIPNSEYIKVVECDVSKIGELLDLVQERDFEVFYHLAWIGSGSDARNDIDIQNQNIQYAVELIKTVKELGCTTFIGAGSQAEYGNCQGVIGPDDPLRPTLAYGVMKTCFCEVTKALCDFWNIRHIWTRIFSVYGPGMGMDSIITSTIYKLSKNENPKCTEGKQVWDFMYSADAARALILLGQKGINGKVYCVGSGTGRTIHDYMETVQKLVNSDAKIEFGAIPYRQGQSMEIVANIQSLTEDTGFISEYSFEYGIKRMIEWMVERK